MWLSCKNKELQLFSDLAHGLIQVNRCYFLHSNRSDFSIGGLMKAATVIGIALIVLGIVALAYRGITYTQREKIVDIGPLQATADREKTIPLPPILGGLSLVGGIVLVIVGSKSRS
jgi:uncharacterized membrane protein